MPDTKKPDVYTSYNLPDYGGSRDYEQLADLAKTQSVVCIVTFRHEGFESRDVAQTSYMSKGVGHEYWGICARGQGYVAAFSRESFIAQCTHVDVEFLLPASVPAPAK